MGCGCGGKKISRQSGNRQASVVVNPNIQSSNSQAQVAKTYQSATITRAPRTPIVRRTV
jgi:hypothetical protein